MPFILSNEIADMIVSASKFWNFAAFAPASAAKKIRSFAHGEFNRDDIVNEENIRLKIEKNEDIFERGYKIKKIEMDESFPKYVLDNKEKLKEWIV